MVPYSSSSIPVLTEHKAKTGKTEENEDEFSINLMAEHPFGQEVMPVALTINLKSLCKETMSAATGTNGSVQVDALKFFP